MVFVKRRFWDRGTQLITLEQFEEFLAHGYEIAGVEFKGPGSRRDEYLCAKVARAVMGMTNKRDGGVVIIGVEERGSTLNPTGLCVEDANSWRNKDHVGTTLAIYMRPAPSFELDMIEFQGNEFVTLAVREFIDVPVICKKNYHRDHLSGHREVVLRAGACYIRSRHKAETVEVSSLEQMRDLLDLATDKGVRKFVTQAQKAGMSLSRATTRPDQELFEGQVNTWTSPFVETIRTRGNWRVILRPETFIETRIRYPDLFPLLLKTSVDIRGWDFPHVHNVPRPDKRGNDWIAHETDWEYMRESWRFYQSAQFMQIAAIREDWPEQIQQLYVAQHGEPGERLYIEDIIYRFSEIFLFASRLALTDAFSQDEYIHIDVLISGLQARYLCSDRPPLELLSRQYQLDIPEFPYVKDFSREMVIATPIDLAIEAATELFYRAGYQPTKGTLEGILARINISF